MLIPIETETDYDGDLILKSISRGTKVKNKCPHYRMRLGYDPCSKKFLPLKSECKCWNFIMVRKENAEYLCKHLKEFQEEMETGKYEEELENGCEC